VRDGQRGIQRQADLGEAAQAVLLTELDQQQIGGGVDHEVGRWQPGALARRQAQVALDARQVGQHQRIAEPAGQPDQHRDAGIGQPHRHAVQQDRGRARHGRAFVRFPAGDRGEVFGHRLVG
jgi:hypothetical protein